MLKVNSIMGLATTKSKGHGECLPLSPCSPHPLLVVEAFGRHVRLHDSLQRANIDPDFHGCRHRQEIYSIDIPYGWSSDNIINHLSIKKDIDRKSTRLNSSHVRISYAVF